jgi:hypothetical protein
LKLDPDPAFQVNPDPDPIRIQGFDDQKLEKKYSRKFLKIFFGQKLQATRHSKEIIQHIFSMFVGHFCPP